VDTAGTICALARPVVATSPTRLETTRSYSLPTAADRERAINSLPIDR